MFTQAIHKKNILLYSKILVLAGFGLAYVFIIPPFEVPDEPAHFLRAYGVAEGQFILKDHPRELLIFILGEIEKNRGEIQIPVIRDIRNLLKDSGERIPNIAFNNSHYSPLPYIFHAAAIRIVMLYGDIHGHLLNSLYICRITTLVLFCLFLFLSFKILPAFSWIIFWIAATPMSLSQAAAVSPDYIVFCASAMLLSVSLGNMDNIRYILYLFLSVLFLFLSKPPYVPLICIPLISVLLSKNKSRIFWLVFSFAVGIAGTLAWSYAVKHFGIYDMFIDSIRRYVDPSIDPAQQLSCLTVFKFGKIMLSTCSETGMQLCHQFVGVLGWEDIPIPFGLVLLWGIFSIAAFMVYEPFTYITNQDSNIMGYTCIICAILTFLSIFFSIYLIWAPVGADIVHVQGRYFHPVACVLFCGIALLIREKNIPVLYADSLKYAMLSASVLIHVISLYSVIKKFS